MASKKTILLIEATSKQYNVKYSGGIRPDWNALTETERREVLRHDGRIANALMSMPDDVYQRFAMIFRAVERCKRREARRAAKEADSRN